MKSYYFMSYWSCGHCGCNGPRFKVELEESEIDSFKELFVKDPSARTIEGLKSINKKLWTKLYDILNHKVNDKLEEAEDPFDVYNTFEIYVSKNLKKDCREIN